MKDWVGKQIDRYRLLQVLGSGGFGTVYLAEQSRTRNQVALKLLPPLGQEGLRSFLTEARMFRLKHPHIIQILDFGLAGQYPFLVMDYAPHGTLKKRYPDGSRVPLPVVVTYVQQLASALQYAHDEQIIHRDVKPENMLLDAQERVLLSDFGIAYILAQSVQVNTKSIIGTLPYMAPEQTRGLPGAASDQYALGIVVYEWLCGRRPFLGDGMELAIQHRLDPPTPPRAYAPGLSPEVEKVILMALAKNPRQRFSSVQAFASAFEVAAKKPLLSQYNIPGQYTPPFPPLDIQIQPLPISEVLLQHRPQQEGAHNLFIAGQQIPTPPEIIHEISPSLRPDLLKPQKPPSLAEQERAIVTSDRHTRPQQVVKLDQLPGKQSIAKRRIEDHTRKHFLVFAIALLVLIIASSGTLWAIHRTGGQVSTSRTNAEGSQQATQAAEAATATAYDQATEKNGTQFGFDAQHDHANPYEWRITPANVQKLALAWIASAGSAHISSSPLVANGTVYISSSNGKLYAFNAYGCRHPQSCTSFWNAATDGSISSVPALINDSIYVSSSDGKLYAFNANGCTTSPCPPFWTATIGNSTNSAPAIANGILYIGSSDHNLYAFPATDDCGQITCAPLWTAPTGDSISSSPAISNNFVYVGSRNGVLSVFRAGGCGAQHICAPVWSASIGPASISSVIIANGYVYTDSSDGKIYAFNANGCGLSMCFSLWTASTPKATVSSIATSDGIIYAGSSDGKVYAFSAKGCGQQPTCLPLWTAVAGGSISSAPTIANGVLYVGSSTGNISAFSASGCGLQGSCPMLWQATTSGSILSSPIVVNGFVYVSTNNGRLYAFQMKK